MSENILNKEVLIGEGAEAKVYLSNFSSNCKSESSSDNVSDKIVIKKRIPKNYRISEIDDDLRFTRTRKEIKILEKLAELKINAPRIIKNRNDAPNVLDLLKQDIQKFILDSRSNINMTFVEGTKLRDYMTEKNFEHLSLEIGKMIATLHNNNIIHGDLTTSNMIFNPDEQKLYFVDFGLSFVSTKDEDKAVDLHLLKQALESYHYKFFDKSFAIIEKEYSKIGEKSVLDRLEIVEQRGRNKH